MHLTAQFIHLRVKPGGIFLEKEVFVQPRKVLLNDGQIMVPLIRSVDLTPNPGGYYQDDPYEKASGALDQLHGQK